jgi:CheY-like chemotaxis protein
MMSGSDGSEICRELKDDPATQDIPVIMISASKELRMLAERSGANDFMEKPFDMNQLLAKAAKLLNDQVSL